MNRLVRSEVLKLRTVATTGWLLAATILVSVLNLLAVALTAGPKNAVHLDDSDLLARATGTASTGWIVVMIFGILVLSQELRFGTAAATFSVTTDRKKVMHAKAVSVALAGVAFAAVCVPTVIVAAVVIIRARGGVVVWDADVAEVIVGVVLVMAAYGVVGLALAALVRNHIAAIAGCLVWVFVVEQLLLGLVPSVARWTPVGAAVSAVRLGRIATTGHLLPQWAGAMIVLAYAALAHAVAANIMVRRDIET